MRALKRLIEYEYCEHEETCKETLKEKENKKWEEWAKWLKERQDAIDNAKTPEEKMAVAARYQKSYVRSM